MAIEITKSRRGFASMTPERRKEIASMGGSSVPKENRSFSKNPALASRAGKVGGSSVAPEDRSFARNRQLAAEAGRKGGSTSRPTRMQEGAGNE